MWTIKTISSLEKVFTDGDGGCPALESAVLFRNERYSYQVAYYLDRENWGRCTVNWKVESPLGNFIRVKQVGQVPSLLPCYEPPEDASEGYLRTAPGLYPDVLRTLDGETAEILPRQWGSLWVTLAGELPPGEYPVTLTLTADGETAVSSLMVTVLPARLPEQSLLFTEWLHWDGIAQYHGAEMFSERFWSILERYVQTAADHGINLLYTPLFTPPLDMQIGGERLTCQLVQVEVLPEGYRFGFDRLKRFLDMARRCGIHRFELSHLFTQWGAAAAPKIMGVREGDTVRLFGWDTPARGEAYGRFLAAFLPELDRFLRREGLGDSCFLHASDEPGKEHLDAYRFAAGLMKRYMPGYPIMDAMSDYSIYAEGGVDNPVVAIDHMEPFLEKRVDPLWGYYCCMQVDGVSNRFLSMPSARNRIIGIQAYRFGLKGFLHWGYNFYNSRLSLRSIDPYAVTDADGGFPSGDAFSVYPEGEGCTESLRLVVFHEALQDFRALCLFESLAGREAAVAFIDRLAPGMTFREYPRSAEFILNFRKELNRRICCLL